MDLFWNSDIFSVHYLKKTNKIITLQKLIFDINLILFKLYYKNSTAQKSHWNRHIWIKCMWYNNDFINTWNKQINLLVYALEVPCLFHWVVHSYSSHPLESQISRLPNKGIKTRINIFSLIFCHLLQEALCLSEFDWLKWFFNLVK